MNQFKAVFPATITPMQADGRFDEQAHRRNQRRRLPQ